MNQIKLILLLAFSYPAFETIAQISIPGDVFNRIDKIEDTTSLNLYPSITKNLDDEFKVLYPYSKLSINSSYPRGYNDGPIWKGKGATWEFHGGFSMNRAALSITLFPSVYYSQNSNFNLAPNGNQSLIPERYKFGNGIDFVQQFGSGPFVALHPGQSEIRLTFGKFSTSISTQNYSAGPSNYNPIILSRQSAGFPHLRLGLEPINIRLKRFDIGKLEIQHVTGLLSESKYFDNNSLNDRRYFNGLFVGFSPSILQNLTIGLNKTLYKNTQFFEPWDLLSVFYIIDSGVRGDSINTNDTFDQLASLTASWNFPDIGFRAYGEFAKNDFSGNIRWTLSEPEHSRAYTIGFEKIVQLKRDYFVLSYEHTNLSLNHSYLWRAEPPFYIHSVNMQGYTHNGQILGAGIGPGSNSDHLELFYIHKSLALDFLFQRIEFNKDYFIRNVQGVTNHDVEYTLSFNIQKKFDHLDLGLETSYCYNMKRYYLSDEINFYLALSTALRI
tara:strand:+ start:5260 stop:6753 length:1494 start_codon:yes stop_codon:yes gene_type:complete